MKGLAGEHQHSMAEPRQPQHQSKAPHPDLAAPRAGDTATGSGHTCERWGDLAGTHPHVRKSTYHFIIDFVEVNFTDFLHHVFIFKSNEPKSCSIKE